MKKWLAAFLAVIILIICVPAFAAEAKDGEDTVLSSLNVTARSRQQIESYIAAHPAAPDDLPSYSTAPRLSSPYAAGVLTSATKKSALNLVNQIRYIAGLSSVSQSSDYTEKAQAAALISRIKKSLGHYPSKPDGMSSDLYDKAKKGAAASLLASGMGGINKSILQGWMNSKSSFMGNRRWILNPAMSYTGFGWADGYAAMYAFDGYQDVAMGKQVAWPAQVMPVEYFSAGSPWTISLGGHINENKAKVKLKRLSDGKTWSFSKSSPGAGFEVDNTGYGQVGCITFMPDGISSYNAGDKYEVTVTGVGETVSYKVEFFKLGLILAPENVTASVTGTGSVRVQWDAVEGVDGYVVYGSANGGEWKRLGSTKNLWFDNKSLEYGGEYSYKIYSFVKKDDEYTYSGPSEACDITLLMPAPENVKATVNGIGRMRLSWTDIPFADGYVVYGREVGGQWSRVGSVKDDPYMDICTYKYDGSFECKVYSYAVINGENKYSAASKAAAVDMYIYAPTGVKAAADSFSSVKISWNSVYGAEGYVVYVNDGEWRRLATVRGASSYVMKDAVPGREYQFKVYSFITDGGVYKYSAASKAASCTIEITVPSSVKAKQQSFDSIKVSWGEVGGADGYVVYVNDGGWKKLKTVKTNSYIMTDAVPGREYSFKVYAFSLQDGVYYYSAASAAASCTIEIPVPASVKAVKSGSSINISWGEVGGADGYVVYMKKNSGDWAKLCSRKAANAVFDAPVSGNTYSFRVYAFASVGGEYYYSKGSAAVSCAY